jgi:hypothetical protein
VAIPERHSLDGVAQALRKLLTIAALVGCVVGISTLVAISPLLVRAAYHGSDWEQQGNIGQAYGAASALLAALALGLVGMSLMMQHGQAKQAQRWNQRDRTREIVELALTEPAFAQCWGSRFAPEHVDERLFYYTNFVVLNWSYAWEQRLLPERMAREFLRDFFDSEVPRMFWERRGDSHHPRLTLTRADRFIAMMNEEYLRAIRKGPPTRPYEPMVTRVSSRP